MSTKPQGIALQRDRDLKGRRGEIWYRRAGVAALVTVSVLALLNVFGQRPTTSRVEANGVSLEVHAPSRVRSGLLYEARFRVDARRPIRSPVLVLDPGWLEGMTVNTIEPSPQRETSRNGRLSLALSNLPAGASSLLFLQFQVDPTNVGHRSQTVELFDGTRRLVAIDRSITIFP